MKMYLLTKESLIKYSLTKLLMMLSVISVKTIQADEAKRRACKVFAGIDEPLYKHYDSNISYFTDLIQTHFDAVNEIYNDKVFTGDLSDIHFKLSRIQVMFGSCASFKYENCTENRSKYLEIFDQYDFSDFCLAYMFTYLDFHNGTAGLASIGTMCRRRQNSGFITLLNNGLDRPVNDSIITLAHELGHSLGAQHDEDVKDEDCGQNYIMAATMNDSLVEEFSDCSARTMQDKLNMVLKDTKLNCLVTDDESPLEVSLCGNGVVEPGEECDCGDSQEACTDPCCYPAHIGYSERSANDSALPCSRTARARCVTPPELFYGIYMPLGFILTVVILVSVFLRHDWSRDKSLFKHITEGNIRIVTKRSRAASQQAVENGTVGEQASLPNGRH
eukprot:TRINITY_DN53321_c0_g1_i1.p1 TRINITY_DN53321_c0_g1~~TRINITY_DN53321_c0_g1_i1.p1  ORF type:complete len:389 (-),score=99.90 TRINITY_DN53321_c0_g1_i1:73-1239(-)